MMTPTTMCAPPVAGTKPRILLVDDEPSLVELITDVVGRSVPCRILTAQTLAQARQLLGSEPVELLVVDLMLPDGDGMSLLPVLQKLQPLASAIVITGAPTTERAIHALRGGAIDFLPKPFSGDQLAEHVRKALLRQAKIVKDEKRLDRLRDAVKRLNEARKIVSRKVDLLCNDLISAYGELSRQLDVVRTQEGFRKTIAEAKDLEQLLCNAMDWMLRQLGYTNIAVWLAANETEYQLGAYMKYTIAGDQELSAAMRKGLVPRIVEQGWMHLSNAQVQQQLSDGELDFLADQTILATNCTYLAESLAAVVLFRDGGKPFSEDDAEALKAISPIFAVALANIVRGPLPKEDAGGGGGDEHPFEDDEKDQRRQRRKGRNDADWWKRGEPPPF